MRMRLSILSMILFGLLSCDADIGEEARMEKWKAEILAVEGQFNEMAQSEGLSSAFEFFAAEDGVIRRKGKIIKGKLGIANWYKQDVQPGESLSWKPTFVDVSASGDLGYTYGDFIFKYPDSLGNLKTNTGIFHTVWKRQADGQWRFVWD